MKEEIQKIEKKLKNTFKNSVVIESWMRDFKKLAEISFDEGFNSGRQDAKWNP